MRSNPLPPTKRLWHNPTLSTRAKAWKLRPTARRRNGKPRRIVRPGRLQLHDRSRRHHRPAAGRGAGHCPPAGARLRDPGRAGPRRHGRRLQGPAKKPQAPRRPEDDPGRRQRRRPSSWPASAPRPRPSLACTIPTSCRSTRSASTRAGRTFHWSSWTAAPSPLASSKVPCRSAAGGEADGNAGPRRPARPPARRRPPRFEAGQHLVG